MDDVEVPPHIPPCQELNQVDRAQDMIREAEGSRARIYELPGKYIETNKVHSALMDEDYLLVGNYVDEVTKKKISEGGMLTLLS